MSRFMKASGALVGLVGAVIAFGTWKRSPLHTHVCGSDAPYSYNIRWLIEGAHTIDNWPARLCGCKPAPGYAEHQARVGFHSVNGHLHFANPDENWGVVQMEMALKNAGPICAHELDRLTDLKIVRPDRAK